MQASSMMIHHYQINALQLNKLFIKARSILYCYFDYTDWHHM